MGSKARSEKENALQTQEKERERAYNGANVVALGFGDELHGLRQDQVHELVKSSKHAHYVPVGVEFYCVIVCGEGVKRE